MSTESTGPAHTTIDGEPIPTLDEIAAQHFALSPWVARTPVFERADLPTLEGTHVNFKFELLQASGSFKARGAFTHVLALDEARKNAGVTCVSAGNHAAAVAYAAMRLGSSAKVVMPHSASPARIAQCRAYRAEVVLAGSASQAFDLVRRVEAEEGRFFIHPFNGYRTILGTATLGYEWATQTPDLDAVIVPIGGGLAAGMATALRLANPRVHVYGVEPEGADAMCRSFAANHTIKMGAMQSIADSLMAPHTEEYSYQLCRRHVDRIVTVSDDALRAAMLFLFSHLKLAVEPACAAALAGLLGPLRETLQGKRVGVLLPGTNTDPATLGMHLAHAQLQR
ncbi:threonine/serine dehydratase [Burkholderia vietnamiensis]|uniref:threonine/serine dehydratase n=1 Tax=Burkholderia vietnamiensis TaxID=60552 RepID=UPI001593B09B|nr:threonine/serine dehydratase [Burkholderia vietnamiensis]